MTNRPDRHSSRLRMAPALGVAVLLLGGCSMAGLPNFAPAPAKVAVVEPPPPAASVETEAGPVVGPLAFAAEPAETPEPAVTPRITPGRAHVDALISKYAAFYSIPETLLHRVVRSESTYNPAARNGAFLGLMQIRYETARTMGYRGTPLGLLDAEANLKYGAKYLRGAYLVAGYNADRAVALYRSGYYYHAKRAGLLEETGLR